MSREFTIEELAKYNGVDEPSIFIACKDTVFDVSDSGFDFI